MQTTAVMAPPNTLATTPSPAKLIWFTGLSGAGKSTLSTRVASELQRLGIHSQLLDGDRLRQGLCKDLGFSSADRSENIRRAGEVAKLLVESGTLTLAALTSPMRADRAAVRERLGAAHFIEIYCKCSIDICAARDVKGLYAQAQHGQIAQMVGRDLPYQEPHNPDLVVDTGTQSIAESVAAIMALLAERLALFP